MAYVRLLPSAADVEQIHGTGKQNWRAAAEAGVDAVLTGYPLEPAELVRNCCAAE